MSIWPETRRTIIIIGSGVSRHSKGKDGVRPPTWKMFLEQATKECPRELPPYVGDAIGAGDFLHACEWIKKRFDEEWVKFLRSKFQTPKFVPSDLHRQIINLDSRIVFTLNFDDIYERTANDIQAGSHTIKNFYDPDFSEFLRGDGRYIVKLHGTLHSPERLIFTQKDYSEARVKYAGFYQAFDAALMTHSALFIGAGYSDPDVNLILENQKFNFPASSPHYFVTDKKENDDLVDSLRKNRNLKTIVYDPIDELHSGLTQEITELVDSVEMRRQVLIKTGNW
jgi:SIR2-like domain